MQSCFETALNVNTRVLGVLFASALFPLSASAHTVTVEVGSPGWGEGDVICVMFEDPEAFPEPEGATASAVASEEGECRFLDVPNGVYVAAAFQDQDYSGLLERNFIGMPKEPWGVSNNVRFLFRAPRFEEAAFPVNGDTTVYIELGY